MPDECDTRCAVILAELTRIGRSVFADPSLELTPETTIDDVPDWDFMNHIKMMMGAECCFGIEFEVGEIENIGGVGDLVRLILSKLVVRSRHNLPRHPSATAGCAA